MKATFLDMDLAISGLSGRLRGSAPRRRVPRPNVHPRNRDADGGHGSERGNDDTADGGCPRFDGPPLPSTRPQSSGPPGFSSPAAVDDPFLRPMQCKITPSHSRHQAAPRDRAAWRRHRVPRVGFITRPARLELPAGCRCIAVSAGDSTGELPSPRPKSRRSRSVWVK